MDIQSQDTSKEDQEKPDEASEAEAANSEDSAEATTESTEEVELSAEEEKAFLLDQLQRAHAELANFRRRTLEDQAAQRLRTTVSVVRSFLPVLDGLEAAIKAGGDQGGDEGIREGLTLIAERVEGVLADLKVEKIPAVGEGFDPQIHEAMLQVDHPEAGAGEIVDEVEKGYRCAEMLIRASRVVVARCGEAKE